MNSSICNNQAWLTKIMCKCDVMDSPQFIGRVIQIIQIICKLKNQTALFAKKLFNTDDPDHLQNASGSVLSFLQKVAHPGNQDYLQTMQFVIWDQKMFDPAQY